MSNPDVPLKFGILLAPFHLTQENPDRALEQYLELITFLDTLGYDYAWVGEHHSGGFENIASPEVFIAIAAERTKNIRLGACVSSLSSQHPLVTGGQNHATGPYDQRSCGLLRGSRRPALRH